MSVNLKQVYNAIHDLGREIVMLESPDDGIGMAFWLSMTTILNRLLKAKLRLLCPMEMSMKRKWLPSASMTTNFV